MAEREVNPGLDLGWNDRDPIVGDDEWGLIDEQIESLSMVLIAAMAPGLATEH